MEKLFQVLRARADLLPYQPALISDQGDQKIITNNQQLVEKIATVEAAFKAQKLACIGLFMDNCSEWIICDLAAAKLGITLVPIPLFFTATQIGHLVKSAHVDAIITKRNLMMALGTNKHLNFTTESELTLLNPKYPIKAAQKGMEGSVVLKFDVTANGSVTNIEVVNAKPAYVFDKSAVSALEKWKYSAVGHKVEGLLVQLDFSMGKDSKLESLIERIKVTQ
jgi:TonB family protein